MSKRCPSTTISGKPIRQEMQRDLGELTQYHLEEGDQEADCEINIDGAKSLRFHRYRLSSRHDLVQATIDHKQRRRQTDAKADNEASGYYQHKSTRISDYEGTEKTEWNRHMSHQTGATFAVLLFQTTELIKLFKQPRPAQAINKVVPTFQARGARIIDQFVTLTRSKASGENYLLGANKVE